MAPSPTVTTTSNTSAPSVIGGKSTPIPFETRETRETRPEVDKVKKIKTDHGSVVSPKNSPQPGQSVGSPLISSSEQRPHSNNSANSTIQPPSQSPRTASSPHLNTLPTQSVAGANTSNLTTSTIASNQTSVLTNASSTTYLPDNKPIVGANGNIINPMVTLEPLYGSSSDGGLKITFEKQVNSDIPSSASPSIPMDSEEVPEKRPRSHSTDNKSERPSTRGKKRSSTGNTTTSTSTGVTTTVTNKRSSRSQTASTSSSNPVQGGAFSSITAAQLAFKESPPSSPGDEVGNNSSRRNKGRNKNGNSSNNQPTVNLNNSESNDSKDIKM